MSTAAKAKATAGRIIETALKRGQTTLSEYDGKRILKAYGVPVTREVLVNSAAESVAAAKKLRYPVVLKACSPDATHKTEKGLVAVGLGSDKEVRDALATLKKRAGKSYKDDFLVQEMIKGQREIMMGMIRDPQFGPSVLFGLGGIFTEVLEDVAFRVAPLTKKEARRMTGEIRAHKILGAVRGMKPVDMDALTGALVALGRIGMNHPEVAEIDINPLIVAGAKPVAVDALFVLKA